MADQDHPARGTVAIGEVPAVDRLHAKGRKEVAAHANGADALWIATASQVHALGAQRRELGERGVAADEVRDVSRRRGQPIESDPLLHLGAELPRHHQPIGIGERQRSQQHGVDNAEDRGVGANSEGERDECDEGEARPGGEPPQGDPDVAHLY